MTTPILLPHKILGNPASKTLLIFLHGFPDSLNLFDSMASKLEENYILCLSYPNYCDSLKIKWGIDFDQLASSMKHTIDLVDSGKGRKKVLVGHDWGAFNSYNFDKIYPGYLTEMMTLDVGLGFDSSIMGRIFIIAYQMFLTLAFLIWRPIGDLMTKLFVKLISNKNYTPKNALNINASFNYFYYYLWKGIFLSLIGRKKRIFDKYKKSCPLVYVYASDKPMMFHSQTFLLNLSKEEGNEMYAVKGGHWIMNRNEGLLVDILKRRIGKLENKN